MTVQIYYFSLFVLGCMIVVILFGFAYYLIRNYCLRRATNRQRTLSEPKHTPFNSESLNRTTSEDENIAGTRPMKTHTFDQILKQEENSGYSLHPLRMERQSETQPAPLAMQLNEISKSFKVAR